MRLVLASHVGAGTDALEAHVDFHLGAGVDVVFLAAPLADVPRRLASRSGVHVLAAGAEELARATEDAGADWVIESDANEFWWPRGGSLKQLLDPVSSHYGGVQALPRHFVPVRGDTEPFWERMTHRLAHGRPERRFVRRAAAREGHLDPIRGWFPIEVLRFPVNESADAYDDDALQRGVEQGVLRVDTRVRDAMRALAAGHAPDFARADAVEEARYALDLAELGQADVAQARDRLDELEARLAVLESSLTEVLKRKLRAVWRRS